MEWREMPIVRPLRASLSTLAWLTASYLLFVGAWTVAALYLSNPAILPTPGAVVTGFAKLLKGTLVHDVASSLRRVFVGFFIAGAVAIPLAMVMAFYNIFRKMVLPIITIIRPIPPIAWIPIAILWFGIGNPPSYFITALAAFHPIFLNSFSGALSVEQRHIHAAKFMGAKRGSLILRVLFPSALPMIWTGLKIGLGQSWMAVVTAELIAAQSGLGYMIQINQINLETNYVLVGMVTIGILGSLMTWFLSYMERFVLPWKQN